MAQQACQEGDHGARHARHFDQQAEEDEQRHGKQNEMAHALVHAADQDHHRRLRGQRQIAEDRQAKRESDRHAGEDRGGDHADEKDQKIEVAEPVKQRRAEPEQQDANGDGAECDGKIARAIPALASRNNAKIAISRIPAGSAAARTASVNCSAGVRIGTCSSA